MSPFRDAPQVELGPLDVGLELAAAHAMKRLPQGGRLRTARSGSGAGSGISYVVGALGSAGVLAVAATALVAWSTGWQPWSAGDLALCALAVGLGGVSLAAVLCAVDRTAGVLTCRGDLVGRKARGVLRRMARLAVITRRGRFEPGHAAALRRALAAAADPELLPWIPGDVRGRAELLLARLVAAGGGASWPAAVPSRREVRVLLTSAAAHLDDTAPAEADLAVMDRVPQRLARRFPEELTEAPGALGPAGDGDRAVLVVR